MSENIYRLGNFGQFAGYFIFMYQFERSFTSKFVVKKYLEHYTETSVSQFFSTPVSTPELTYRQICCKTDVGLDCTDTAFAFRRFNAPVPTVEVSTVIFATKRMKA